jgi:hypothetical protein
MVARGKPLADGRFQASVERWRRALGIDAAVRVLASAAVEAPVVVGWLKPVILWPAAALLGLPAHELDALVVHELAHVRRQDALMNLLQACIDVLFFHHPAAWWISGTVRAEREHCADDLAVRVLEAGHAGSRLSYAKALLALEERRQAHALALAANGGSLLDRIRRLAGVEEQPASPVRPLAAAVMASLLLAVLIMAAAPIREARADELPKDTNKIESLTVEQAKRLADTFPGVPVGSEDRFCACGLPLQSLKIVDADVAKALSGYRGNAILLTGLTTIDADVAEAFAGFRGTVFVPVAVQQEFIRRNPLNAKTACMHAALLKGDLTSVTTLDAETAKALAGFKGYSLMLNDLTSLDADTARALAEFQGGLLSLCRLRTLDAAAARALAEFKGTCLALRGLDALDADTAKALARYNGGELLLDGLRTLDAATAKELVNFRGQLHLSGLTAVDADAAIGLAGCKAKTLCLSGLTTLSAAAAKALAQHEGNRLDLNGLTTLSDEAAKALAQHEGDLSLNGLTTLSDEAATALGQRKGQSLSLNGLTTLSDEAAKALAQHKGNRLDLSGLTTLSGEAATALAQHVGRELALAGLTTLSAEAATALAQHKGTLFLNGLTTLSGDAAKALAQHKGQYLRIDGLTTLSAEAATALAQHEGELRLNGLTTLSGDAATALAQHKGDLILGLTTLSAEAAKALAQHEGALFLNGLTTLSAEAAKAFAQFKGKSLILSSGAKESFFQNNRLTPETALLWAALSGGKLTAVTTLDSPDSVAIAKALATHKGPLSLPNLKKLSPKTLSALIEKEDIDIPLIETLELIPEPDGSPTKDFVIPEGFQQRQNQQRQQR